MKIFFVTDLHGSEICWKKFLNAGSFYGADVVILGRGRHRQGDGAHRPARERHLGGLPPGPSRHPRVRGRDRRVREARDEPRLLPDPGLGPGVRRDAGGRGCSSTSASRRSCSTGPSAGSRWPRRSSPAPGSASIACPANDDMFEIDDLLTGAQVVETGRRGPPDRARRVHDGLDGVDEPDALAHVPRGRGARARGPDRDRALEAATDPETTIFNFHAPPYGSKLDNAPALNADLTYVSGGQAIRPVGSTSVHEAIKRFQPMLVAARAHPREQGSDQDREDAWR